MELIDFNNVEESLKTYGGLAGRKLGIYYQNEPYILKFPNKITEPDMKERLQISYTTSPYSEFVGSHIYGLLGLPVHETLLGKRGNHEVVACKDFVPENCHLTEFREFISTINLEKIPNEKIRDDLESASGNTSNLDLCLKILNNHPRFDKIRDEVITRFWDMFVIDAFIGNPDRNNGNWGFIVNNKTQEISLAPVYDNGNSFNDKYSMEKIKKLTENDEELANLVLNKICIFTKTDSKTGEEKKINPNKYIQSMSNKDCNKAVKRFIKRFSKCKTQMVDFLKSLSFMPEFQREFYLKSLSCKYHQVLLPTYNNIIKKEKDRALTR